MFDLIIAAFLAALAGVGLGYWIRRMVARKQAGNLEEKMNRLIIQSKDEAREILLNAKSEAVKIKEEVTREHQQRERVFHQRESTLAKRDDYLNNKERQIEEKFEILKSKAQKVKKIKKDLEDLHEEQLNKLEKISQLSKEEAREEVLNLTEQEYKQDLLEKISKMEQYGREHLEKRAQNILSLALQRYASSHASETTTTAVNLPNEEIKGRIIGKEGRNIKALEKLTGVEIIVDDTPEAVVISAFNPIRRQIAKMALEKLIADGRIQPARIEEVVEKTKQEVAEKIREAGETAVYDVGVVGLDPKLVRLLGRLRFRTSYGQNVLLHSIETAHLAGAIAAEVGADVNIAKKAGLLHDIGKAVDHEIQGSHVEIGMNILKKFSIPTEVIDAMKSHHEDFPHSSVESSIVTAADALSGARPGARKDTLEAYLKRLEELEDVAKCFDGVDKVYAIQAGREVRVFVTPDRVDDLAAKKLARDIARKIEEELKYPGEIKVNVIREMRVIEYAK